ncbi:hypothetical protein KKB01_03860, partial [bacterium]|nr:hypothetical protein [bacterium]
ETGEEINANTYNHTASVYLSSPVSTSAKININTANATMLQTLSGIGEKKFEGIKDLICVQ